MLGHSLSDIGMVLSRQKKFADAEVAFKRALKILERAHGEKSAVLAPALQNYAQMLRDSGRESEASKIHERLRSLSSN